MTFQEFFALIPWWCYLIVWISGIGMGYCAGRIDGTFIRAERSVLCLSTKVHQLRSMNPSEGSKP